MMDQTSNLMSSFLKKKEKAKIEKKVRFLSKHFSCYTFSIDVK